MKQVTNMSRLVNQLEKMFRALNTDMFDNALDTPIITVIPTPKAYAHYVPYDICQDGVLHITNTECCISSLRKKMQPAADEIRLR